jgi:hypothetical protein
MPSAPRVKNKATKIAYKVMGIPVNIAFKRSKKEREVNRRLNYEESYRAR